MGIAQSFQSLAGFVAPVAGGALMGIDINYNPLVTAACFMLIFILMNLALVLNRRLPEHHKPAAGPVHHGNDETNQRPSNDSDIDVKVTQKSPLQLGMSDEDELSHLRTRVASLEEENKRLLERLAAFEAHGGVGEYTYATEAMAHHAHAASTHAVHH